MKINNLKIGTLLIGVLLFLGCFDLEEEVFSEVTADNFFLTDEQVVTSIGSIYTNLYNYLGNDNMWSLNGASTDELVIPTKGTDWFENGHWQRLHRHEWLPTEPYLNINWNMLYFGVNSCNRVIYQLEEIGTDEALAFVPELRAFRAFYFFHLMDLYGGVPLITDFLDDNPSPSRASRKEVYDFIESELKSTLNDLSRDVTSSYGRMNFYAAQATLAKLYANSEEYIGEARWEDCLAACREITGSGAFSMTLDYFDNFDADTEGTSEFIFAIPYDETDAKGNVTGVISLHYANRDTYDLAYQPWNGWTAVGEFYDSYEDTDKRKGVPENAKIRGNFLVGQQFSSSGEPLIDNAYEPEDPDGAIIVFTPHPTSTDGLFFLRQDGARLSKFEYEKGGRIDMNNDFAIYRYTDFVLLEAEMLWRLDREQGTALALVNAVRDRAGVLPYTELTEKNIYDERGRELFAEGIRRHDMIRFGTYGDAWFEKAPSDATKTIFPIPQNQLDSNASLTQNPGY
tara:strand:+ start:30402 stop:31940 length:1539 start_codon:yes stop_codon:yes gene_type:complete